MSGTGRKKPTLRADRRVAPRKKTPTKRKAAPAKKVTTSKRKRRALPSRRNVALPFVLLDQIHFSL